MTLEKPLEELDIPTSFTVVHHEFFAYDPVEEYSIEDNHRYLGEDLFQVIHEPTQLVIDLGWYGNKTDNKGEFVLNVIRNDFWDEPVSKIFEKSQKNITSVLKKTLFAINTGLLD